MPLTLARFPSKASREELRNRNTRARKRSGISNSRKLNENGELSVPEDQIKKAQMAAKFYKSYFKSKKKRRKKSARIQQPNFRPW